MILYHFGHFGALSKLLLIHLTYHFNDDLIILVDELLCNEEAKDFLNDLPSRYEKIVKVIRYSDKSFSGKNSIDETERSIEHFFGQLFQSNKIKLDMFDVIYSSFDTFNAFGVYALRSNVRITFVDAFNTFYTDRYHLNGNGEWGYYDEVIFKYKALGYGCINKNCHIMSSGSEIAENYVNFGDLKKNLNYTKKNLLLRIYGIHVDDCDKKDLCTLLVFSSGWVCAHKNLSRDKYFYYYQLLLDLFCDSKQYLLLKPHPSYPISADEANKYFGNAKVISALFPSEFIDLLPEFEVCNVLSTSSSGVPYGIYGCKYVILFDIFYFGRLCKRLYLALQLIKYLQPNYNKYFHHGLHNKIILNMEDKAFSKYNIASTWANLAFFDSNSITIIDDYLWNGENDKAKLVKSMETLTNNAIIIFLDSQDKNNFLFEGHPEFCDYLITLKFFMNGSEAYLSTVEKLTVFCKDPETLLLIKNYRYSEYLQNSKIECKLLSC